MAKFLNISTDNTLGGNSPSDNKVSSEKAVKGYVDASIPSKISDLTDDTATHPVDKADTLTGLTATVSELNVLDGVTATTTELNYVDGVTSNIQTQLNSKASTSDISNMVTTDTFQTITGGKSFSRDNIGVINVDRVNTDANASSTISFSNNGNSLGFIGLSGVNSTPIWLDSSALNSKNLVRNQSFGIAVGSSTLPVYIDSSGIATTISSYGGTSARATGDKNGDDITTKYVTVDTAQTISETKTFTAQQKFQDGNGTGCIIIGADISNTSVTEGVRKLGRIVFHTKNSNVINCAAFTTDTNCTIDGVLNDNINCVEIGGRPQDITNTSPDRIGFTVAKVQNTVTISEKLLVCDMDKDGIHFHAQPDYNGDNLVVESTLNKGFVADGSIQSDSAGFNRINYYNNLSFDINNFTKAGNIVVTDGVASGFSTANYIYTIGTLPTTYNTFEIHFGKFNFSSFSTAGGSDWMFSNALPLSSGGIEMRPAVYTSTGAVHFRLWLGTSGSWDIASSTDADVDHAGDIGKNIELKLVFDGLKYILSSSVDGGTWQTEKEITSSSKMAGGLPFYFGGVTNVDQHTADLKAFKIIADSTLIFTGEQLGTASYVINGSSVNIPYKVTPIGRIVDSSYRTNVSSVYSTYGYAPYFTLDTANSNYTLPKGEIYGLSAMMAKQVIQDART